MSTVIYEMFVGERFFPDKEFLEEEEGLNDIKELVTLGFLCIIDSDKDLFVYFQDGDKGGLYRFGEKMKPNGHRIYDITEEERDEITRAQKQKLNDGEQLIYAEMFTGKQMNGQLGFEFCGYELHDGFVSIHFDCDGALAKYANHLNKYGLFDKIEDASEILKKIREDEPYEQHFSDAFIYGIWRYHK